MVAILQAPSRMLRQAMWVPTREDEHAVSTVQVQCFCEATAQYQMLVIWDEKTCQSNIQSSLDSITLWKDGSNAQLQLCVMPCQVDTV